MFAPGPWELLIIAFILGITVIPVIVVLIIVFKSRSSAGGTGSLRCPDCRGELSETDEDCPACGRAIM